ncbi:MAG: lysophospholipid acyltransferase family protein [Pseudomonadales bacterium]
MSESQTSMSAPSHASPQRPPDPAEPPQHWAGGRWWHLWQALTMPLFYPSFGLACVLLLALTGYAQVRFDAAPVRTRWLRQKVQKIARIWLGWGSGLRLLRHDIDLRTELPADGCARIVVANHPSLVDVIFVLAEVPNVCCVLKAELGRVPVLGMLVRKLDYLSNDDPEHLLQQGSARLAAGESLLIFPEGTRTKGAKSIQFRLGAAELALRSKAPILPIMIHYHGRYLSGLGRWFEFPDQQLHYTLEIGPERPSPDADSTSARRKLRRPFNRDLEDYITERLRHGPRPVAVSAKTHWSRTP